MILSKKTMTVGEVCEFMLWLREYKGFDGDEFADDPDGFEEQYDEYTGRRPVVSIEYAAGLHGLTDHTEIQVD